MTEEQQVCTFQIAGSWYGLEVTRVREIVLPQQLTPVPLANRAVAGLINLRGQIVTAIELRRRLGLPERMAEQSGVNIVIETDDGAVSLIADDIGDVLWLSAVDFEPPPETLHAPARELTLGVYKLSERLLVLLDPERLVELSAQSEQHK